ncbi:thiamine pyrophosphate-dependent dehydrogenase E1 component subunit alpha [Mycobacterium sp. C31M]
MTVSTGAVREQLNRSDFEFMYRVMKTSMVADDRARSEARAGALRAAFYPVRGLEGVCAALGAALDESDYVVSTYRNLGDLLAKRVPLRSIISELYGRSDGTGRGKGGPMHIKDASVGLMATSGIVGAGIPIAVGLGLATQLDDSPRAVVVTFGDGATATGAYHEAIALAAVWRLPVVFVCQNNQWAEHTPIVDYTSSPEIAKRAGAYELPATRVDGFDPIATYGALREAIDRARNGNGPTFVECVTYRLGSHSANADYSYMPKDELAAAQVRDPAPTFRRWLLGEGVLQEADLSAIDDDISAAVTDAFDFAQNSARLGPDELYSDVFGDKEWVTGR